MYENMTTEHILSELLSQAPDGIDTRPGSIYYDAVKGCALVIARQYADLDITANLIYIDTTGGEYLDKKAEEHGLSRNQATCAVYSFSYTGTTPSIGSRFYYDGLYFTLALDSDNSLCLVAEAPGEASNNIESGTPAIPVNSIAGLTSATFGAISAYGTDTESDEGLRERLRRKISGPAENGNKAHYKAWCEEVNGVGRAKIVPLWDGPNTVKGVLISPNGTGVSSAVVAAVQEYVDPNGEGLGEGAANLGAHFTAVSATELSINVTLTGVEPASGYTLAEATAAITTAVTAFLKNHALTATDESSTKIYISAVGAEILALNSVSVYATLKLNNNTTYVTVAADKVAVIGTVSVNA